MKLRVNVACRGLITGAIIMVASGAYAADEAVEEHAEIVVIGKSYGQSAGAKSLVPLKDISNVINVVDQEQIQQQNLFTLEELMTSVPGVTITGVGSEDPAYHLRGFAISNYMVDGVASLGSSEATPDLFLYDRVEVLRGPAGLFSGSGSPAGSINLVRKRPFEETRISGELGAGSWKNYRAATDISLRASDMVGLRVGALYQDQDQFYDTAHRNRILAFGVGELKIGERTVFTIGGFYERYKPAIQTGLPGLIGDANGNPGKLLNIRRSTYLGGDWNRYLANSYSGFAEIRHEISDDWTLRATAGYYYAKRINVYSYIGSQPVTPTNGMTNHVAYRGDYKNKNGAFDFNGIGKFKAFGREHSLVLGFDYQSLNYNYADVRLSNYAKIDVYNPVSPKEPPLSPYVDLPAYNGVKGRRGGAEDQTDQFGIYGQSRLSLFDGFTLVVGGRLTWWEEQTYKTIPTRGPASSHGFDNRFTPYAGATYAITPEITIYASYADSFEPQSSNKRRTDGKAIEPLIGAQYEAGIKTSLFNNKLLLSAVVYSIEQSNRIQGDPDNEDLVFQTGMVRSRGFEVDANGEILPGWRINGGYSFNTNKYAKDAANQNQPFQSQIPKHSIKFFTNYAVRSGALAGFSIGVGATYLTKAMAGNRATRVNGVQTRPSTQVVQGGYVVANARIGYDITDTISLSANVTNLFDRKYYARIGGTGRGNFYGIPRSFFVTLRAKH